MHYSPSKAQSLGQQHFSSLNQAALFMGAGLGKTAAVLTVIEEKICSCELKGILIVAPLRVVNLTWPAEVSKWDHTKWLRVANLRTKKGWDMMLKEEADIYLCNFEMLPKLKNNYMKGRRKADFAFNGVLIDELTKAKNYKSKRIAAVRPYFSKYMDIRWGMTGTPTPNGLLDLFGQIRVLDDGILLGKSYPMFRQTYFNQKDYHGYKWEPKKDARKKIYDRLGPFAMTLTREEFLGIPDIQIEDVEVKLSDKVQEMYKELQEELFLELENAEITVANAAVLLNKLLQVTSGAIYYESNLAYENLHGEKINALLKLLKKTKGNTLVCYIYKHECARIKKAVTGAVAFSDAKTQSQQKRIIDDWNAGRIPVLLANPASMSHGLNMQEGGSDLIWYTCPWDFDQYDQTICRLARRGQECVTNVWRLITRGTVDEAVVEALRRKDGEQSNLLSALTDFRKAIGK